MTGVIDIFSGYKYNLFYTNKVSLEPLYESENLSETKSSILVKTSCKQRTPIQVISQINLY